MNGDPLQKVSSIVLAVSAHATGLPSSELDLRLRRPLDAQSNNLYDLFTGDRHLIVKEFLKEDELLDAPAREHSALLRLAEHDIAPQPVLYDASRGPIVIYEFMPGEMWDRRVPSAAKLADLAELWLHLHSLPTDGLWLSRGQERPLVETGRELEHLLERYAAWVSTDYPPAQRAVSLFPEIIRQGRRAAADLAQCAPDLCFCRSDARFANVIDRPSGRLGLIDWEDAGLRDPARDLGTLLTHPNQEDLMDELAWQPFLGPYLAGSEPLDPTIRERMDLYLGIFPLFWLAILLNAGVSKAKAGALDGWAINDSP
jgi:thiamine kinase-like enzyme